MGQVYIWETNESELLMNASKASCDVETMYVGIAWNKSGRNLITGQMASGVKVA